MPPKQSPQEDIILAEEGTLMYKFQKERTDSISEMFANEYDSGIYPTSHFFARLDKCVESLLKQKEEEGLREIKNHLVDGKDFTTTQMDMFDIVKEITNYALSKGITLE